jgi:hypothetical protein
MRNDHRTSREPAPPRNPRFPSDRPSATRDRLDGKRLTRRLIVALDAPTWQEARAGMVEVVGWILRHAMNDSEVGPLERR